MSLLKLSIDKTDRLVYDNHMKKKAVIFMDYNETFDDVSSGRGNVFSAALKRMVTFFQGNVDIIVITAALPTPTHPDFSIRSDLLCTISYLPTELQKKFTHVIEGNCQFLSPILQTNNSLLYGKPQLISRQKDSKKLGVELALKSLDKNHEYSTCIFVGDSEISDLEMLEADIGNREKYCLIANRRILKSDKYPIYRISFQNNPKTFNYGKDIINQLGKENTSPLIIRTSNQSYGVGRGLEAITSLLEENERIK